MFCCDSYEAKGTTSEFAKVPAVQTKLKFVSLLSGGKDSVFNTMECVALGHELVCVANLYPADKKEKDSYMY